MKRYEILGIDVTDDLLSVSWEYMRKKNQDQRNPFSITWVPTGKIEYTFKFKRMSELTIMSDYVNVVDLEDVTDTSELTKKWIATYKDMPHLKVSGGSEFDAISKAYRLMGSGFIENDWVLKEVEVHKPSLTTLEVNLNTTTNKKEEDEHKHYDMIVAKAANKSLVRFTKLDDNEGCEWVVQADVVQNSTQFSESSEYFLCIPKHKESVLRGLNGETVETASEDRGGWIPSSVERWDKDWWYMLDDHTSRIKPKKEKRLIASFPWGGKKSYVTPESFPTMRELHEYVDMHYGKRGLMQIHEIEIEL